MGIKIQSIIIVLIFCLVTIVMSTYASNQVNLVENGTASLEFVPSKGIYVSKAYVYQDGDDLVITGKVKRHSGSLSVTGHVDIVILDPKGTTLKKVAVSHVPRIVRRQGASDASFSARLPIIPPKGATVRLGFHSSKDSEVAAEGL
jgi:hypothetical protein